MLDGIKSGHYVLPVLDNKVYIMNWKHKFRYRLSEQIKRGYIFYEYE